MRKTHRLRAPFVITLAASTLSACGGSTSTDSNTGGVTATGGTTSGGGSGGSGNVSGGGGSGNVSGSGGAPGCPAAYPAAESSCSLPDQTTCSYPQGDCCPPWQAVCDDGKWQTLISSCNPPYIPCPETAPSNGDVCGSTDPCMGGYQYCTYGTCADGTPQTIAECNGGTWSVKYANCAMAPCEKLSACECFDRTDCEVMSDSCICPCDYNCPGDPPCVCACGGGTFLGCKTKAGLP